MNHQQVFNDLFSIFSKHDVTWSDVAISCGAFAALTLDNQVKRLSGKNDAHSIALRKFAEVQLSSILLTMHNVKMAHIFIDAQLGIGKGFNVNEELYASINLRKRFEVLTHHSLKCVYCGRRPPEVKLQLDHKIPKSKGGTDELDNLVPACFDCNVGKNDMLLKEEEVEGDA